MSLSVEDRNEATAVPFILGPQEISNMLGNADATAMIAVKDLERARRFYEDTLGLQAEDDFGEGVMMKSGDTRISVYRSEYAGTNKATALTFDVDDIAKEMSELKVKGILFEHYDLPGLQQQGDFYVAAGMKTAWFKDPDGNILSLIESTIRPGS